MAVVFLPLVSIAGSNPSAFQAASFQQVSPLPFTLRAADEPFSGGLGMFRTMPREW
jgi:hypothetical protein